MSRRRRSGPDVEDIVRAAAALFVLLALAIGGVTHFAEAIGFLMECLVVGLLALLAGAVVWLVVSHKRAAAARARALAAYAEAAPASSTPRPTQVYENHGFGVRVIDPSARTAVAAPVVPAWDARRIRQRLDEIDWYQFEKFCAALLEADGVNVERRGGAQPDGGVDLVVEKQGARALIQCKHWRTWTVQEKVVRELLGSMTHFGVNQGALYTLKGWTQPAADFAAKHAITLVNGDELAASAMFQLSAERLDELLDTKAHHCPKCESPMIWREGDFTPFWGCSKYPRCHFKLNSATAAEAA